MLSGQIRLQENGRWLVDERVELHSGDVVQLRCDLGKRAKVWFHGRIEHAAGEYHFLWIDLKGKEGKIIALRDGMFIRKEEN